MRIARRRPAGELHQRIREDDVRARMIGFQAQRGFALANRLAILARHGETEAEVGVPLSALPRKYRKYLSGYEQITPQG